jgi:hypothetical protein
MGGTFLGRRGIFLIVKRLFTITYTSGTKRLIGTFVPLKLNHYLFWFFLERIRRLFKALRDIPINFAAIV